MNLAAQQYKQNSVLTATPGELTQQLYNGLVKFIKIAIDGLEKQDFQTVNINMIKSQDIIQELLCTLDMKYPIAHEMAALYEYMVERLTYANVHKDKVAMEEVLGYAEEFRAVWYQALKQSKQG